MHTTQHPDMLSGLLSLLNKRTMSDEVKELERKLEEAKKKAQQKNDDEEDVEQEIDEEEPTQKNEDDVHDEEDETAIMSKPRHKQIAKKAMKTLTPKKPTVGDKGKASAKKKPRGRPPTGVNGVPKQWDETLGDWVEGVERPKKRQRVEDEKAVVDADAEEDWRTMMWTAVKKAVKPYVAEIVREVLNE